MDWSLDIGFLFNGLWVVIPSKKKKERMIKVTEALQSFFGMNWWQVFKGFANYGAPAVCILGILWYVYDRMTGGI